MKFPKIWAAAAAVCLCQLGASAGAQTMAKPGQMAAPGRPAGPMAMPAGPDDPAKVAAARQFIIFYHPATSPAQLAKMFDKMMPRIIAQAKQQDPKADAKKLAQERRAMALDRATKSLEVQARAVARHFSLQELNTLTNFFRNGVGKKLAEETPKIQMELMMQRRQQSLMQPVPGMKMQIAPAPQKGAAPHK